MIITLIVIAAIFAWAVTLYALWYWLVILTLCPLYQGIREWWQRNNKGGKLIMSGYDANAYLVYGIKFEHDSVFPWSWDGNESVHWSERGEISAWWRKVNGYGLNDDYPHAPIDTIKSCDYWDTPIYILTPWSLKYKECRQGYPVTIQPSDLTIPETARDELIAFCEKYGIKYDNEPQWWLVACYE